MSGSSVVCPLEKRWIWAPFFFNTASGLAEQIDRQRPVSWPSDRTPPLPSPLLSLS